MIERVKKLMLAIISAGAGFHCLMYSGLTLTYLAAFLGVDKDFVSLLAALLYGGLSVHTAQRKPGAAD